jgi:hypothetical protein
MRVPSEPERKEDRKANLLPLFSFFLIVSLFFSFLIYSISPSLATDGVKRLSITSPALAIDDGKKLSIVLIDGEEIYVRSGNYHTFSQAYQLYVKGTDTDGKRVWLELRREGAPLKDAIVTEGSQFVYAHDSTEILNLTLSTIYTGADGVLVRFSPVYQYLDPKLPMPQTLKGTLSNSSNNTSSKSQGSETKADGFDMPLFILGLGAVLVVTGFFAGKGQR